MNKPDVLSFDVSDTDNTILMPRAPRPVASSDAVEVDEAAYDNARDNRIGWCPDCEEFTTPGVLASEYRRECVDCSGDRVCGTRHARANDFISVDWAVLK